MKDKIEKEQEYYNFLLEEECRLVKLIEESKLLLAERRYRIKTQKKYLHELKRPSLAIDCEWCNGTGVVKTLLGYSGDDTCLMCDGKGWQ